MDTIINNINYSNINNNLKLDINNINIYHLNTINNIKQNLLNFQYILVHNQKIEANKYYNNLLNNLNSIKYNNCSNNNLLSRQCYYTPYNTEYTTFIINLINKYIIQINNLN